MAAFDPSSPSDALSFEAPPRRVQHLSLPQVEDEAQRRLERGRVPLEHDSRNAWNLEGELDRHSRMVDVDVPRH